MLDTNVSKDIHLKDHRISPVYGNDGVQDHHSAFVSYLEEIENARACTVQL